MRLGSLALSLMMLTGLIAGCASQSSAPENNEPVTIRWLIGFGTGLEENQLKVEQDLVNEFNATHDDIKLEIMVRELFAGAPQWEEIKTSPNAPDLIGPIGQSASLVAKDDWLVLTREELGGVEFSPSVLEGVATDGGYLGMPVGVYPSMMIANREAFDKQGLALPPDRFGAPYEGRPWTWDEVSTLATQLTLDVDGHNAADPAFSAEETAQFGFAPELVITPLFGQSFAQGSAKVVDGRMEPPPGVIDGWHWLRDRVYVDQTSPDLNELGSTLLNEGSPFTSGNVALGLVYSWGLSPIAASPDVEGKVMFAVPPSHDGVSQVPYHADEFKVLGTTKHRKEAVTAMQFLLNQPEGDLFRVWGPVPSRLDLQERYIETMQSQFPKSNFTKEFLDELLGKLSVPSPENAMALTGKDTAAITFGENMTGNPDSDPDQVIDTFLTDLAKQRD